MAIVACKECGKEVSDQALSCPSCGVRLKTTKVWIALIIVMGMVVAFFMVGVLRDTPAAAEEKFHPEQIVYVSPSGFGCDTMHRLNVAIEHYNMNEITAWATATAAPNCFAYIKNSGEWTIYQIRGNAVKIGKSTLAQHNAVKDRDDFDRYRQYWVPGSYLLESPPPAGGE